jgi:hypothetical protein
VKELLGHQSIKMTLRYAHLAPAHIKNAVGRLDERLTSRNQVVQKLYNLMEVSKMSPRKLLK